MSVPILSVIIPCYNSGRYLPEAVDSVKSYPDSSIYEIIIVNDGSADEHTLQILAKMRSEYRVIDQENKGPAAARNAGVKAARGKYLLMLDSDNKVRRNYISKGIELLNARADVDIVYANPAFFGENAPQRVYDTHSFNIGQLIISNYIDNCALIRKAVWEALGGQDENRQIIAHEDWDFWLRAADKGYKFYYLNETGFDYRVSQASLVSSYSHSAEFNPAYSYVYGKHAALINKQLKHYNNLEINYQADQRKPFRSFIKFIYHKYFKPA